jgi:hypothetical protein
MGSLRWLRVISVLGVLIACFACNRAPAANNPPDTRKVTPIKRDTARSQRPAHTGRVPSKRIAQSGNAGAAQLRRSEESEAVASNETAVETAIDVAPPSRSMTEFARAAATLSAGGGCGPNARRGFVVLRSTDAFMKADASVCGSRRSMPASA